MRDLVPAIRIYSGGSDVKLWNNTVHGFSIWLENSAVAGAGNEAKNNACVTGTACQLDDLAAVSLTASNNVTDVSLAAFVDASAGDYHLTPAATQLIDQGTDVGLPYSGRSPDVGAFELGDTAPPAAPTDLTVR